jgi:hypothetical protein
VVLGGYHLMFDPQMEKGDYTNYKTFWRNILIMNADEDDYGEITLEQAALATGRWEFLGEGRGYGRMIGINDETYMRTFNPQYDARDMRDR